MGKGILTRSVVSKWIQEVLTDEYTLTIYPNTREVSEKDLRLLKDGGWDFTLNDDKVVVLSKDPISLARLAVKFSQKGYFVETD